MVGAALTAISRAKRSENATACRGSRDTGAMSISPARAEPVHGWPLVFRGSVAVRAGLVTPAQLRGPRFRRLFPDTYVPCGDEPPDLAVRSRAAHLYSGRRGIPAGYSAADLLGAPCGPRDTPAELALPGGSMRPRPGLLVHRDRLRRDEVEVRDGVPVTTPLRTAYDLARRCVDLVDAVVALDALANKGRFDPAAVLEFARRYPRARGRLRLPELVGHSERWAGSPMETRMRMLLVLAGLPRPEVQFPVQDEVRRRAVWLDLAYPAHRIGIEYEGEGHASPEVVLRDIGRYTALVDAGWRIYRFTKYEVYGEPDEVVAKIARALGAR